MYNNDENFNYIKLETKNKKRKPIITNILLSLMFLSTLIFSIFLILDSTNRINEIYQIVNAIILILISLSLIISFPKTLFKNKTTTVGITSILIIIAIIFNILYLLNIIKLPTQSYLPDFYNKSLSEMIKWAEKNNINHKETFEYSDNIKKYNIISQNKKAKTLTKNIKNLTFAVSNGPDYNKEVILPDMINWTTEKVLKFIEKNNLKNVDIVFEENAEIKNNLITKQSHIGKIKRNDEIIFTASLGNKKDLKPLKIKNLRNKKLLNAKVYLGKRGIIYELKYEFSNTIERGKIIKINPKEGATINPDDKVILTVSKGKEIKIPELKNMSLSKVTKWIIENNLNIEYTDEYNNEVKKGLVISSNYKTGDIIEEETKINIIFSKGKLLMPKFEDIESFKTWASAYGIKYEIKEEFNETVEQNKIIKFSINENDKINLNEPIIVYISKGKSIIIPDFVGKTKETIQKECNSLEINCTFYNTLSDKKEGTAISQSINKGAEIAKGQNIEIEIATKKQTEVTKKKNQANNQTNNNNQNSNNNTNNSNNNNSNQNTCEPVIIRLTGAEVMANDPNGTCNNLKNKYGGAIICSYVTSDDGTNGFIINSSEIRNKEASTCNPITVKIVKNN